MYSASGPHDIERFFRGLAEHAFHATLGVVDPPLVNYVSDLLVRFLRSDRIAAWPGVDRGAGSPASLKNLRRAAEALLVATTSDDSTFGREEYREVGDAALFWSGLYPEAIGREPSDPVVGQVTSGVVEYHLVGKRAYLIASTLPSMREEDEGPLLERLSHEFDLCVAGLTEVRRAWGN